MFVASTLTFYGAFSIQVYESSGLFFRHVCRSRRELAGARGGAGNLAQCFGGERERESRRKMQVLRRRNGIARHFSSTASPHRRGCSAGVSHSCLPLLGTLVTTTLRTLLLAQTRSRLKHVSNKYMTVQKPWPPLIS